MGREAEYGSPFRAANAGVDESKDKENRKRYRQGLKAWRNQEAAEKPEHYSNYDFSPLETFQAKYGIIYGPILGYAFGKFYTSAFTSPRSRYLPKILIATSVAFGLKYGIFQSSRADMQFLCKNFKYFPKEVQDALQSGDARYLRKYLDLKN